MRRHDAKPLRLGERRRRHAARGLPDRARAAPTYDLDDLMAEYGVELEPDPPAEEETAALVRHAEAARRLAEPLAARGRRARVGALYREIELPLTVGARRDGGRGRPHRHLPHGRDHGPALRDRIEELEARAYELAGEEFVLGSPQQLGADPLREARAHARPQGQDRYSTDAKVLRAIRARARDRPRDRGVARAARSS